jgi:streptomycin 6-kinase
MSVVCLGLLDGTKVVVKAPLDPADAEIEAHALSWFAPSGVTPQLRHADDGVLMMSYVEGAPVTPGNATAIAAALAALHGPRRPASSRPPAVPPWKSRQPMLLDEYAQRLRDQAPDFDDVVAATMSLLPAMLEQPHILLHGDLQGKNVLESEGAVRVLDPLAASGPVGWEFAHAACSIAAAAGNPEPVIRAGLNAGLTPRETAQWLRPAAVHHAGVSSNVSDRAVRTRLRKLLNSHPVA